MAPAAALPDTTTPDGYLLVLAILLPVTGILLSLVLGGRYVERIVAVVVAMGAAVAAAVLVAVWSGGEPLVYIVGGWSPPLGLALRADGLSAAMMMVTAIVVCGTGLFARGEFSQPRGAAEERGPLVFWILLLAIWSALNAIVLGNDLFNLYVALELLTFAAVPLVCLKGTPGHDQGGAALHAVRTAGLRALSARNGADLRRLRHARHRATVRPGAGRAGRADCGGTHDHGAAGQDRPLSVASVAAARACRRSGARQRHPFGAGRQGIVLPDRAHLVRRHAGAAHAGRRAAPRRLGRWGDPARKRAGPSPGAAEAADRLFHDRPDRLPVLFVSARRRPHGGRAREQHRLDRWMVAAFLPCLCEGSDVHGRRAHRRSGRPRPDSDLGGIGRVLPITAVRVRIGWPVADGRAAERRLRRQVAAAGREPSWTGSGCGRS